jgi:hypothetical protein
MNASNRGQPLPLDYDRNPDRFRTGRLVVEEYGLIGEVYAPLAAACCARIAAQFWI